MTAKRSMIYDPDTRRYKRIKPVRCDYQDALQKNFGKKITSTKVGVK